MRDFENNESYSIGEEIANSVTHGIGAILGIAGLVVLIVFGGLSKDPLKITSFAIYGASLIIMYLASTLYHSIQHKAAKKVLEIIDHSAIYLLIAGTYTPFTLIPLKGRIGWIIFTIVWALSIVGVVLKVFFVKKFMILSTIVYIALGWFIVFAFKPLVNSVSKLTIWLLVFGGLSYTLGTIFYIFRRLRYGHMIWHLFVLFGSILHFFAVFSIVN
ncbi:MAG: hemolysin III family protein [Fervidobacterium sp.]|nr:hemolysin III family protein [Fervidobacterium sp.]